MEKELETLPERDRLVLEWRHGLADDHECTLEEIARRLNLTRERIRQIEGNALKNLQVNKALRDTQKPYTHEFNHDDVVRRKVADLHERINQADYVVLEYRNDTSDWEKWKKESAAYEMELCRFVLSVFSFGLFRSEGDQILDPKVAGDCIYLAAYGHDLAGRKRIVETLREKIVNVEEFERPRRGVSFQQWLTNEVEQLL